MLQSRIIEQAISSAENWLVALPPLLKQAKPASHLYRHLGLCLANPGGKSVGRVNHSKSDLEMFRRLIEDCESGFSEREVILTLMVSNLLGNTGVDVSAMVGRTNKAVQRLQEQKSIDQCDSFLINLLLEPYHIAEWDESAKETSRRELLHRIEIMLGKRRNPLEVANSELTTFCKCVFALTEYGTRMIAGKSELKRAIRYLQYLAFYHIKNNDIELVSTLLVTLAYLGMGSLPEYSAGVEYLLDNQNKDGSFGLYELELNLHRLHEKQPFDCNEDIYLPVTVLALWALATTRRKFQVIQCR